MNTQIDITTHDSVADFFISFAQIHGDCITNLKLQKLVYYAQAWHLAIFDAPLFEEEFQAWVHGPVCPPLYARFRDYRWNPISLDIEEPKISLDAKKYLTEVCEAYGQYSGYQLEQMTHTEAPWIEARGGIPLDEASTSIIAKQAMREYYAELIEK